MTSTRYSFTETFAEVPGATLRIRRTATDRLVAETLNYWEVREVRYRDHPQARRAVYVDVLGERYTLELRLDPADEADPDQTLATSDGWALGRSAIDLRPNGNLLARPSKPAVQHVRDQLFPALAAWLNSEAGRAFLAASTRQAWSLRLQEAYSEITGLKAEIDERRDRLEGLEAQRDILETLLTR